MKSSILISSSNTVRISRGGRGGNPHFSQTVGAGSQICSNHSRIFRSTRPYGLWTEVARIGEKSGLMYRLTLPMYRLKLLMYRLTLLMYRLTLLMYRLTLLMYRLTLLMYRLTLPMYRLTLLMYQLTILCVHSSLQKEESKITPPSPIGKATVYTHLYAECKMWFDPPKSPLKRGTLILVPPFLRGVRGDQNAVGLGYQTCVYTVAIGKGVGGLGLSQVKAEGES